MAEAGWGVVNGENRQRGGAGMADGMGRHGGRLHECKSCHMKGRH